VLLVDTTVWVDFFAGRPAPHVAFLESALEQDEDVCTCGVILTEILQGIRNDAQFKKTSAHLDTLLFLPMGQRTFVKSAEIYRHLRRKGITVRKPIDCMIAAVAIENSVALLHNDKDFAPIEKHCGLKTVKLARQR